MTHATPVPPFVRRITDLQPTKYDLRNFAAGGGADDRTAIQAFLDGISGGDVYVPASFRLTGYIRVPSNTRLISVNGLGELYGSSWFDTLLVVGQGAGAETENVHIDGVTFRYAAQEATRQAGQSVAFSRCHNSSMRNCRVEGSSGVGVALNRVHGFHFEENAIDGTLADGVLADNGSDATAGMTVKDLFVHGNRIQNTGDDAIAVYCRYSAGSAARSRGENVTITDNIVRNVTPLGGGIGVYGVDGILIDNNQIYEPSSHGIAVIQYVNGAGFANKNAIVTRNLIVSTRTPTVGGATGHMGIRIGLSPSAAPDGDEELTNAIDQAVVEGNTIIARDRHGIYCGAHSSLDADPTRWSKNLTVRGNRCVMTGTDTFILDGIYVEHAVNAVIEDNTVTGYQSAGLIARRIDGMYIRDNRLIECVANAAFSTHPIAGIGDGNDANDRIVEVVGNYIRKTSGTASVGFIVGSNTLGGANYVYQDNLVDATGATLTNGPHVLATPPTLEVQHYNRVRFSGDRIGFFGVTPVDRPAALTAANAGTINTGDATSDTVIANMRTRIGELESKLQSLGLLQ